MADERQSQVRASLHELAQPVATDLRRDRMRRAAIESANAVGWSLVLVPAIYLVVTGLAALLGADARLAWYVIVPLWLIVPIVAVLRGAQRAGRATVSDIGALAEIDRELKLCDRLSAAREFVDAAEPDGFKLAAIRDAERRIESARGAKPTVTDSAPSLRWRIAAQATVAVLLLLTASQFAGSPAGELPPPGGGARLVITSSLDKHGLFDEATPQQRTATKQPEQRPKAEDQKADETAADEGTPSTRTRRGRNPSGAGRSAQARASAGGGSERGQPSNQAQSTKGRDTSKPKPKEPKEPKAREKKRSEAPPKPQQQSGATQGRGSGRGSSRSPTATPWASKDQVVSDEQEEIEEDEEIDDENDESEARGGLQPNLRQRKPPVNRDLQISMGGGPPNEDANGRGGPGGPKKQRGVAQLVLGVTFPDHVTSPPNPGMSKVTQERIEPQARESEAVTGEDRGERAAPMGHLSRRTLTPWMQDLVRKFYLRIRDNSRTE